VSVKSELLALQRADKEKILRPQVALAWARRHRTSELFARLEWDDDKAADEFRLSQIRSLIQIHVVYDNRAPMMVSLTIDRHVPGGGYRSIEDVAKMPDLRELMLRDALNDLERAQVKYARVLELADVWSAVAKAKARADKRKAGSTRKKRGEDGDDGRPSA
jgi:hypothetical protein